MEVLYPKTNPVLNGDSTLILILAGIAVRRGVNILIGPKVSSAATLIYCLFEDVPGAHSLLGGCENFVYGSDINLMRA